MADRELERAALMRTLTRSARDLVKEHWQSKTSPPIWQSASALVVSLAMTAWWVQLEASQPFRLAISSELVDLYALMPVAYVQSERTDSIRIRVARFLCHALYSVELVTYSEITADMHPGGYSAVEQ
jgi:hypothetical protein